MSQLKIRNGNDWYSVPAGGAGVPSGGSAGDVLVKSSSVDYATEWATINKLEVKDFSDDFSLSAKGYSYSDIDITYNGYEPIGVVGYSLYGTGSTWVNLYTCMLNSATQVRVGLRETNNSAVTVTVTVYVLFRKV